MTPRGKKVTFGLGGTDRVYSSGYIYHTLLIHRTIHLYRNIPSHSSYLFLSDRGDRFKCCAWPGAAVNTLERLDSAPQSSRAEISMLDFTDKRT
jgi:hypothetical protein